MYLAIIIGCIIINTLIRIATAAVAVACVYWPALSPVLYSLLAKSKTAAVAAMMLLAPIVRYAYA